MYTCNIGSWGLHWHQVASDLGAHSVVVAALQETLVSQDKVASSRAQLVMVPDEAEQARWVADRILEHREAGLRLTAQGPWEHETLLMLAAGVR